MKSIGIITMHRVPNYGSAIQAYALQEYIRKQGYCCSIINYKYPNEFHLQNNSKRNVSLKVWLYRLKREILEFIIYKKTAQKKMFANFYKDYFIETDKEFTSPQDLKNNCPQYDLYVSGSDQIWNPNTQNGDTSYLCGFRPNTSPAISFSSSFTTSALSKHIKIKYKKELSSFSAIGVREQNGLDILNDLGLKGTICCDPSFLLSKEDYHLMAEKSKLQIKKKYILAYILNYAFNPYPKILEVIDSLRKQTCLPVYFLLMNSVGDFSLKEKRISAAGPLEFISLIENAEYVVTSSFHGTALSLVLEKNFYTIVPDEKNDGRIISLLKEVGCIERGITSNQNIWTFDDINYEQVNKNKEIFINKSKQYLIESIKNAI